MSPIWISGDRTLVGAGNIQRFDPGTGSERYQRALDALIQSDCELAVASFTFDPDQPGSVVLIPERVTSVSPEAVFDTPSLVLADDGIDRWNRGFETMSVAIDNGTVEKVVLARQLAMETTAPVDPLGLVRRLGEQNPDCFVFEVDGLVGASPELLLSLQDNFVRTNVLAGTAASDEDLLTAKIGVEHDLAVQSAQEALRPHLSNWSVTNGGMTRQGQMVHASTSIEGTAHQGTTFADVLADLHPTAAVCGTPASEALNLIRTVEPPRSRYAGPIGWFDTSGNGVFAIALRCLLIEDTRLTLYAGGGLVTGSEPISEFEETELKLQPVLRALGQRPRD